MNMSFFQSYLKIDEILKDENIEAVMEPLGRLLKLRPADPYAQAVLKDLGVKIEQNTPTQRFQALGDAFLKNGILDMAQKIYQKVAEIDPHNVPAHSNLAKIYRKQGFDSAAKKVYLHLAELALTENDLAGALDFAQKAIELKSVEAGYILGLIEFRNKKWAEAKTEFENLLRIKVSHLGALIHLGKTFVFLDQPVKAKENFQKALKVDKDNLLAQEAWVEFCFQGGDKAAALPHLTVLLDKSVAENQVEQTAKFSKMMIQLQPALAPPRVHLIESLQALSDFEGASEACRALARVYEQQEAWNEATQYLEKALKLNPANAEVLKKALADITQKAPPLPSLAQDEPPAQQAPPSANVIEIEIEVPVNSDPDNVVRFDEITAEEEVESQPLPEAPANEIEAQMSTASLCVRQGLLKAAIEIYQQILKTVPDSKEVRKKLNEVNTIYLQQWTQSKK
jgi:tetratricopeptide (TPR) repeat protein